jgi:hypothetical protein
MPIGTTAPFSAMSGVEKKTTSFDGTGAVPPSAFIVTSSECVSKAPLLQDSARVARGRQPASATFRATRANASASRGA